MEQEVYARIHEVAVQTQPLFEANGWTYTTSEGAVVPTVDMIESMIASLAWQTIERNVRYVTSGRFEVERRITDGLAPRFYFKLVFY